MIVYTLLTLNAAKMANRGQIQPIKKMCTMLTELILHIVCIVRTEKYRQLDTNSIKS